MLWYESRTVASRWRAVFKPKLAFGDGCKCTEGAQVCLSLLWSRPNSGQWVVVGWLKTWKYEFKMGQVGYCQLSITPQNTSQNTSWYFPNVPSSPISPVVLNHLNKILCSWNADVTIFRASLVTLMCWSTTLSTVRTKTESPYYLTPYMLPV